MSVLSVKKRVGSIAHPSFIADVINNKLKDQPRELIT